MTGTVQWRDGVSAIGASTGYSIQIPSDAQAGDAAIVGIIVNAGSSAISIATSGWTQIGSSSGDAADTVAWFWKVISSGEPGSLVVINYTGGAVGSMALMGIWYGNDQVSPIDQSAFASDSVNGTSHTVPGLTTDAPGEDVCSFLLERVPRPSTSFSSSGGIIEQAELGSTAGAGALNGCIVDSGPILTTGTVSGSWAISTDQTSFGHAFMATFVVKPAGSSAIVLPFSDVTTSGWTRVGAPSTFAGVEADTDDATYAASTIAPVGQVIELALGTAPAVLTSVVVRAKLAGGATTGSMTVTLKMGSTVIASQSFTLTTGFANYIMNLNSSQQSAQTSLSTLRVNIAVTAS